jgi:hypothetical protein
MTPPRLSLLRRRRSGALSRDAQRDATAAHASGAALPSNGAATFVRAARRQADAEQKLHTRCTRPPLRSMRA